MSVLVEDLEGKAVLLTKGITHLGAGRLYRGEELPVNEAAGEIGSRR
jgi:hypothetical protein